jgi:hypothetical protein
MGLRLCFGPGGEIEEIRVFRFNLTQYWRPFRPLHFRYCHTGLKPCALCARAFSPKHSTD